MAGLLDGIRVIDMTFWQQGPYATAMLADFGADVIHIEGPASPDPGRNFGGRPAENGLNPYWHSHNRGKRALALDLKDRRGQEVMYRLADSADVFATNMRLKALSQLGIDIPHLQQRNPRLIFARASGNGLNGPHADHGSYDNLGQARGGVMMALAGEDGRPRSGHPGLADHTGAILFALAIMSGLYYRERTGTAQEVHSSLLGGQMCIQSFQITGTLFNGNKQPQQRGAPRGRPISANNPTWNIYQGSDGKWFVLGILNDSAWPEFTRVMNRPEWLTDQKYCDLAARMANAPAIIEELQAILAEHPASYWVELFTGNDLVAGPVNDYSDLLYDPQTLGNSYIVSVPRGDGGPLVQMVGCPITLTRTPAELRSLAPEFDQHTEEVLLELGYGWEEMESLRGGGVIGMRQSSATF
jgi:crotonobetainyl-CoA:carnitine CoA-transferase CaiB-like acyl-CoA transferase